MPVMIEGEHEIPPKTVHIVAYGQDKMFVMKVTEAKDGSTVTLKMESNHKFRLED